jgi:hypothetical protein
MENVEMLNDRLGGSDVPVLQHCVLLLLLLLPQPLHQLLPRCLIIWSLRRVLQLMTPHGKFSTTIVSCFVENTAPTGSSGLRLIELHPSDCGGPLTI